MEKLGHIIMRFNLQYTGKGDLMLQGDEANAEPIQTVPKIW